jgi:hypothetical protein
LRLSPIEALSVTAVVAILTAHSGIANENVFGRLPRDVDTLVNVVLLATERANHIFPVPADVFMQHFGPLYREFADTFISAVLRKYVILDETSIPTLQTHIDGLPTWKSNSLRVPMLVRSTG